MKSNPTESNQPPNNPLIINLLEEYFQLLLQDDFQQAYNIVKKCNSAQFSQYSMLQNKLKSFSLKMMGQESIVRQNQQNQHLVKTEKQRRALQQTNLTLLQILEMVCHSKQNAKFLQKNLNQKKMIDICLEQNQLVQKIKEELTKMLNDKKINSYQINLKSVNQIPEYKPLNPTDQKKTQRAWNVSVNPWKSFKVKKPVPYENNSSKQMLVKQQKQSVEIEQRAKNITNQRFAQQTPRMRLNMIDEKAKRKPINVFRKDPSKNQENQQIIEVAERHSLQELKLKQTIKSLEEEVCEKNKAIEKMKKQLQMKDQGMGKEMNKIQQMRQKEMKKIQQMRQKEMKKMEQMRQENENQKKQNQHIMNEIRQMEKRWQEKREEWQKERNDLKDENDVMRKKIMDLENQVNKIQHKLMIQKEKIIMEMTDMMEQINKKSLGNIQNKQKQIQQLTQLITQKTHQVNQLKSQIKHLQLLLNKQQQTNKHQTQEINRKLYKQIEHNNQILISNQNLTKQLRSTQKQFNLFKNQSHIIINQQISLLNSQKSNFLATIKKLQAQIANLKSQILKQKEASQLALKQQQEQLSKKIRTVAFKPIKETQYEDKKHDRPFSKHKNNMEDLCKLEFINKGKDQMRKQYEEKLKMSSQKLEKQLTFKHLSELSEQKKKFTEQIKKLTLEHNKKLAELKNNIQLLKENIKKQKAKVSELEESLEIAKQKEIQQKNQILKLKQLQKENTKELQSQIQNLIKENNQLKRQLEQGQIEQNSQQQKQTKELKFKLSLLQKQKVQFLKEKNQLNTHNSLLKKQILSLQTKLKNQYNQQLQQLKKINLSSVEKIQFLNKQKIQLEGQLARLKINNVSPSKSKSTSEQSAIIANLQQQNRSLHDQVEELNYQVESIRQKLRFQQQTKQKNPQKYTIFQSQKLSNSPHLIFKFFSHYILEDQEEKKKIITKTIQDKIKRSIKSTKLIYIYDPKNKTSFHQYVDGKNNFFIIIKTQSGKIIGAFTTSKFQKDYIQEPEKTQAFLFAFNHNVNQQIICFDLHKEKKNARSLKYDANELIIGNEDIKLKWSQKENEILSNFAHPHRGAYNAVKRKVQDFLQEQEGERQRYALIQFFECYQIYFDQ